MRSQDTKFASVKLQGRVGWGAKVECGRHLLMIMSKERSTVCVRLS